MTRIVTRDDVMGGEPHIEGHRIAVRQIVQLHQQNYGVGEIAEELSLDQAAVDAALDYYENHPDEIQAHIDREQDLVERVFG